MNKQQYTVKASSELMKLLSSGIYSNKILAVVRELTANALDVTQESGDVQLEIKTIKNKHFFIVKDTGPGLTADETIKLISTYGNTTKSDQDTADGMFGIGSKSPFAYTREFYIKSIKNGEAHYFKCYKDDDNYPFIEHLKSEDTKEPSGLEYRVPIENKDVAKFIGIAAAIVAFQYEDTRIKLSLDISIRNADITPYVSRHTTKTINIRYAVTPQAKKINDYIISRLDLMHKLYNIYENITEHSNDSSNEYYISNALRDNALYKILDSRNSDTIIAKIGSMCYQIKIDRPESESDDEYENMREQLIHVFKPSELMVTGSRESVEETPSNIKKILERQNQVFEYIRNLIKKDSFFIDQLISNEQLIKFIEDIKANNRIDKYTWKPFFKKESDKKFFHSARLQDDKLKEVQFYIEDTYRGYDPTSNKAHVINYITAYKNHKTVICGFPRNGIDVDKIRELGTYYYFVKDKELTTLLKHKQFVNYLKSTDALKDNIIIIDTDDRNQYARTKKKSTSSAKAKPHASMYLYSAATDKKTEIKELDDNKKNIYFYYFRNELHVARSQDLDPDYDPRIPSLANAFHNYLLRPLTINESAEYQLVVFSSKQEALKYFQKNKVIFNLSSYSANQVQSAIDKNKFLKHLYYFLSLKGDFHKPLEYEKKSMLENDSYWYPVVSSFLLNNDLAKCKEARKLIYRTRLLIDRIEYSSFKYNDIDKEYLKKVEHFARFMYAVSNLFDSYYNTSIRQTIYKKAFNLYKKIYIESGFEDAAKTEINIFEPILERKSDD